MANETTTTHIFISHITEEKTIADALADLIRSHFASKVEVFVSSIPLGTDWFDRIKKALFECQLAIVLASPQSVRRPWINFESGVVFGQGKKVIPLCHSGMAKSKLPPPLTHLHALPAIDSDGLRQLLKEIAEPLGDAKPHGATVDQVDFSAFISAVTKYEQSSVDRRKSDVTPSTSLPDLNNAQAVALEAAVRDVDTLTGSTSAFLIQKAMQKVGFTPASTTIALKSLQRAGFLDIDTVSSESDGSYQQVTVREKAWEWLEQNHRSMTSGSAGFAK